MEKEENIFRVILRSEITWVFFLVGAVWAMVVTIIIPINNIQNNQATMQTNFAELKVSLNNFDNRITDNSNNILILQQEIKQVIK